MSADPVVALCDWIIRSYGVSHDEDSAVDAARVLLVAWDYILNAGPTQQESDEARDRILAIVEGLR